MTVRHRSEPRPGDPVINVRRRSPKSCCELTPLYEFPRRQRDGAHSSLLRDDLRNELFRGTYFVTITFVFITTVFGFFTFAVARGVIATDSEHVPMASAFTVVFDAEQIFFELLATVSTTFAPLGTQIFADLLIVENKIFFPFFTFGITALTASGTTKGTVVVGTTKGTVVVGTAVGTVVVVTTKGTVVVGTAAGITAFDATDIPDGPPALLAVATNV